MIVILMGVSGCGKTHIGRLLSEKTGLPFYDGDNFHPPANIRKMQSGRPLTEEDRLPWLKDLARHIEQWEREGGAILACSALRQSYRKLLASRAVNPPVFVHLKGPRELIARRLSRRESHFMPPDLLASQFETLEEPEHALTVSIDQTPEEIVEQIMHRLSSPNEL